MADTHTTETTAPGIRVYTLKEVAETLKVSRQSVYNWVTSGRLRAYKLAGYREFRVLEEDLIQFIKEGCNS